MTAQNFNCLIAGGSSFIGANLAEALLFQNCAVVAIDDLTSSSEKNINKIKDNPKYTFIKGNINKEFPSEIYNNDFDAVFHLAGVEDHSLDTNINLDTLRTNAIGTANLLELAKRNRAMFLFTSSIEVYLGVLSSLNIENYFGKTEKEQKKYSLAEAKRFGEALIWEYRKKYNINARIVRISEVYGPGMDLKSSGSLGRFLEAVSKKNALCIYGDGLKKEYYTHIRDVVFGLYQAMFAKDTVGKIYPVCKLKPVTELEIAYLIQSLIEPKPGIVFKPPLKEVEVPELKIIDGQLQKDLGWEPKVNLKDGVRETLKSLQISLKNKQIEDTNTKHTKKIIEKKSQLKLTEKAAELAKKAREKVKTKTTKQQTKTKKPLKEIKSWELAPKLLALGSTLIIAAIVFLPFIETSFWSYQGWQKLNQTKLSIQTLETEEAVKQSQKAESYLQKAQRSFSRTYWIYALLNATDQAVQIDALIHSAKITADALNNTANSLKELTKLKGLLTNEVEEPPQIDFRKISLNLSQANRKIKLAQAEINEIEKHKLPHILKDKVESGSKDITKLAEKLDYLESVGHIIPAVLGFNEPQTCLILLQNSNELRPTGGFIGSYGEVTINKGTIKDIKIDDIYNPDGELDKQEIVIIPPQPLQEHLQVNNWRMRDSNWAVSFPLSARAAQEFYFKATDIETQCVLGIDLFFVEDLLKITGPLEVEEFEETINAENLFEKAEFIVEAEYQTGSDRKRTFLSALGQELTKHIFNIEQSKTTEIINAIEKNIKQKHLLLYHSQPEIRNTLAQKNWDGHVIDTEGDYLYVVDANLGATKSNYFVERTQKLEILNIDRQGTIENTLILTYKHTGEENVWPGGPYKNYLRILVPDGSWLKSATKSETIQDALKENIKEDVIAGGESGKTTFETVFTLNAGQTLTYTFTYRVPQYIYKPLSATSYNIYIQKQPGTGGDQFSLEFVIPFGKEVTTLPQSFNQTGRILKLETPLKTDLNIQIPLN